MQESFTKAREKLLTPNQVSEWLGLSAAWVRDHASGRRRPVLPSVKLGKAVRFRVEDVERFLEACARFAPGQGIAA